MLACHLLSRGELQRGIVQLRSGGWDLASHSGSGCQREVVRVRTSPSPIVYIGCDITTSDCDCGAKMRAFLTYVSQGLKMWSHLFASGKSSSKCPLCPSRDQPAPETRKMESQVRRGKQKQQATSPAISRIRRPAHHCHLLHTVHLPGSLGLRTSR